MDTLYLDYYTTIIAETKENILEDWFSKCLKIRNLLVLQSHIFYLLNSIITITVNKFIHFNK